MKEWIAVHENEVGGEVKAMRSDNGGEYVAAGDLAKRAWNKTPNDSSSVATKQWGGGKNE